VTQWFAESFSAEFDKQAQELGRVNIAVFGKTGVGKSTLVNAIFGERVAATGIGAPVTMGSHLYFDDRGRLGIIDTRGVEIGRDDDELIKELAKAVKDRRNKPLSEQIHVAWYCVRGMDRRFEDFEERFVRTLDSLGLPVVMVLTQVPMRDGQFHPDAVELAHQIEARSLPIYGGRPFLTYAMRDQFTGQPAYGLIEVLRGTFRLAPTGVQAALAAAQEIDAELKASQSNKAIAAAVTAAAAAAAVPIPFSAAAVLVPIQLSMMARIAHLYGIGLDKAGLLAVASTSAATSAGRAAASSLLKFIPGAGSIVGGVINASVASGLTLAMGQAWLVVCQRSFNGSLPMRGGKLDVDAVRRLFEAELASRLPKLRWHGEAATS
jgi:uncharacterized protein (DUF697 family)/GTP-binding protein EngB required for normal cell division